MRTNFASLNCRFSDEIFFSIFTTKCRRFCVIFVLKKKPSRTRPILKKLSGTTYLGRVDRRQVRPDVRQQVLRRWLCQSNVNTLLGDSRKARRKLKWKPTENIHSLIEEMIKEEYKFLKDF